jgi:hypothetical protein
MLTIADARSHPENRENIVDNNPPVAQSDYSAPMNDGSFPPLF